MVIQLPLTDRFGNQLIDIKDLAEGLWPQRAAMVPMPATLVVVLHEGDVLMVFDAWRRQWELPGGRLEAGENWRAAGGRELEEETGIRGVNLSPAAVASLELVDPDRREQLAVYRTDLDARPPLRPNPKVEGFRWWFPLDSIDADMSPLDATIARQVAAWGS